MKTIYLIAVFLTVTLRCYSQTDPATDTTIFNHEYEVAPQFRGGLNKFKRMFLANQKHLSKYQNEEYYTPAQIYFMIEKDGKVHDIHLSLYGIETSTDIQERALSAFKKIKGWKPARIYNKTVRSNHIIEAEVLVPYKVEEDIFLPPETYPQPKIGYSEFYKYIKKNRNKTDGVSGWVFVNFIVNRDGSVSELKVKDCVNQEASNEAVRLIKEGGLWQPGIQGGRPVRVMMTMPVSFD
ncbi:energy transducer TonB [Mucilaginibacter sp. JRF]|uniref:energy transducer TonB n=1 Tax=Mucilaginibacter sp. JRF TaxID=2780088 RepID=UPI00187DDFA8|nr:energy transducer TonB [Mucilaginibacter sp. JRF]MBE9586174.1 energy transducer TonB [Mucilaginibacter sp. JRF]